jgi:hypothetical protein
MANGDRVNYHDVKVSVFKSIGPRRVCRQSLASIVFGRLGGGDRVLAPAGLGAATVSRSAPPTNGG